MIQENSNYNTEDDISPEEQKRILDEVAREKGYRDAEHLRNRAAKNRGFVNWEDYRQYLFRAGQIYLTKKQETKLFQKRAKKKRNGRRAIGRLIGNSLRGVNTARRWIKDRLNDPIDFVKGLKSLNLSPADVYDMLGMDREEYLSRVQFYL